MTEEVPLIPVSGLVTFYSFEEIRQYVKGLMSYYERQYDHYSQKVGTLMRLYEKRESRKDLPKNRDSHWKKVGMLSVNSTDTLLGTLEIMLDSMEEYKVKMTRTSDVLIAFDEMSELNIPEGTPVTLFLRNGVPLRVLVDLEKMATNVEALVAPRS